MEHKFKSLNPEPTWASKAANKKSVRKDSDEDDDDDDLERFAGDFGTSQHRLDSSTLNYKTFGTIDRVDSGKVTKLVLKFLLKT